MVGNSYHIFHSDGVYLFVAVHYRALICETTGAVIFRMLEKYHLRHHTLAAVQVVIELHLVEEMRVVVGRIKRLDVHNRRVEAVLDGYVAQIAPDAFRRYIVDLNLRKVVRSGILLRKSGFEFNLIGDHSIIKFVCFIIKPFVHKKCLEPSPNI